MRKHDKSKIIVDSIRTGLDVTFSIRDFSVIKTYCENM